MDIYKFLLQISCDQKPKIQKKNYYNKTSLLTKWNSFIN